MSIIVNCVRGLANAVSSVVLLIHIALHFLVAYVDSRQTSRVNNTTPRIQVTVYFYDNLFEILIILLVF